jgi:hypothetical protein
MTKIRILRLADLTREEQSEKQDNGQFIHGSGFDVCYLFQFRIGQFHLLQK